jgi:hypothetical protein
VNRLVCAIREGVPEAIGDASDETPRNAILEPLALRLSHGSGLTPEDAMWAMEIWYEVLIRMPDNTGDANSTKLLVATRDFYHRATRDLLTSFFRIVLVGSCPPALCCFLRRAG